MNAAIATTSNAPWWMRVVFGRNPKRTLVRLLCMILVSFVLFRFVLIPIRVSGLSMWPTYKEGKVSLVNHLAYRWKKPQRGDIVAIRIPEDPNVVLLKRIVGLPGERVLVKKGRVYINGELLTEPYTTKTKDGQSIRREVTLDEDQYFVIGDNRPISILGPILDQQILGKVLF
jgi:signal peptidase I